MKTITVYGAGGFDPSKPNNNVTKEYAVETPPPKIVSMRKGRLALLAAGLLDQIDDAIAATPDATKRKAVQIEWEYAQVIDRDSPLVRTFADQLDMSEDDLDELFRQAWSL